MRISDWSSDVCSSDLPVRLVSVDLGVEQDHRTGAADRVRPLRLHRVDLRSLPTRPQSFRLITSCSISLSNKKSATIFFSRPFSCSSSRRCRISDGVRPAYFFFQLTRSEEHTSELQSL